MMTKLPAFGRLLTMALVVSLALVLPACVATSKPIAKPNYSISPEVIAVVGDFGTARKQEGQVARMVASFHPSFVVTVGDNVYNKKGYKKLVRNYYPQKLVPAPGNHDYLMGIKNFDRFFAIDRRSRSYAYRASSGVDFFILDSTAGLTSHRVRVKQRNWLVHQMHKSTANFKVVILHHPPYSSAKHGSTKVYQWNFGKYGADLVLSGHDHTYERVIRRGLNYVVDGTGGAPLYPCKKKLVHGSRGCFDKHYGALFLYVNAHQLRGVFRTKISQTLDTFVINK